MCDRWLKMLSVSQSAVRTVTILQNAGGLLVGRNDKRIAWRVYPAQSYVAEALSNIVIPQYAYAAWDTPFVAGPGVGTTRMAFTSEQGMDYMKHGDACQREIWLWNSAMNDDLGKNIIITLMLFETLLPCPVHMYIQNEFKVT